MYAWCPSQQHLRPTARKARRSYSIPHAINPIGLDGKLPLLARSDLLDHLTAIRVIVRSVLPNCYLPAVAVRLNGNRHIGGPLADVLHFYLYRGFEFGSCF